MPNLSLDVSGMLEAHFKGWLHQETVSKSSLSQNKQNKAFPSIRRRIVFSLSSALTATEPQMTGYTLKLNDSTKSHDENLDGLFKKRFAGALEASDYAKIEMVTLYLGALIN